MPTGVELIAAERERQVTEEGFTAQGDQEHEFGELAGAGTAYAERAYRQIAEGVFRVTGVPPGQTWRWSYVWWKPSEDPIRNLVKAGALIAAEIDLQRERAQS